MSLGSSEMGPADIAACCNNGGGNQGGYGAAGMWGMEWIWIIVLFLFCGWGNNGWGNNAGMNGASGQGALTRGDLCQDMNFSDLESSVRGVNQGLCDGFYAMNTGMLNGFHGVDNAVCTLGNSMQQGFNATQMAITQSGNATQMALMQGQNALATQLANCCCETQQNIQANTTQGVMNTQAIQQQIQQCCCDNEKAAMQSRFDAAQYNCNTLQAIDRVGDRIIDYLAADKAQALRDENQALRLAASQQAQNNYLVNQLRPCPIPAYPSCNPWAGQPYGSCAPAGGCGM